MSSSFVKSKLKASRDAIQAKDWTRALEEAKQVLEYERDNYNAQVFRGLALLHLQRYDESEEAYRVALQLQPSQLLAWQGLEKFYSERKSWEKLAEIFRKVMDLAMEADDCNRVAEALQKLVALQRAEGSRSQLAAALSSYLPDSAFHALLLRLPVPDQTNPTETSTFEAEMAIHVRSLSILEEVVSLLEAVEADGVEKEVEKRRTRLDSASKSRESLQNEVGVEVWRKSKLPKFYEQILSHVDSSDDVRREAEHKLFTYRYKFLRALPTPTTKIANLSQTAHQVGTKSQEDAQVKEKKSALEMVQTLASGIVAINVADELAWSTTMEWEDVFSPADLPWHQLRAFIDHFPRSGLAQSFKALLYTIQDDQFVKEETERYKAQDLDVPRPDPLSLAITGLEEAAQSVLSHTIAAALYSIDRDWLSCSDVATEGLDLARRLEVDFAVDLKMVKAGLEARLAFALTNLHPPQYHARALRLADSVLSKEVDAVDALICKAYIAQTARRWEEARKFFTSVEGMHAKKASLPRASALEKLSISPNAGREARLEVAWCDVKLGELDEGRRRLEEGIKELDESHDATGEDCAKAWWRLGCCLWELGGVHREEVAQAFTCFITALKKDSAYAPAFTSLGFYYSEIARPSDPQRAAKCFQKAFELDAGENEAALRLAQSYSEEGDWDLVYLVAQRTIEGEGGGLALRGEVMSQRRHITRNAWAWTAIGSADLERGDFEKAIVAFQIALRSYPREGNIWMRLGEAYAASSRLTAAISTFEKALEFLEGSGEEWQAHFSIANVMREQGRYHEALDILGKLIDRNSEQLSIRIACAESRLSLAEEQRRQGYTKRGKEGVIESMREASQILAKDNRMLPAWKILADGFFHCFRLRLSPKDQPVLAKLSVAVVEMADSFDIDSNFPSISSVTKTMLDQTADGQRLLLLSIYLNKLRVLLHHNDEQVAGSVWMDLTSGLYQLSLESMEQQHNTQQVNETRSQAIACVKEALKMEPGNGTYWSALGDLVFDSSVKLAQHCYIKAVESDSREAQTWSRLGLLYLSNTDLMLAKQCFVKAQTLDSDFVQAWIGQAMIAMKQGNERLARSFFQQARAVDEGNEMEAAYGFASCLFQLLSKGAHIPVAQLDSAFSALSSYLSQRPNDASALHLSALYAERLGEYDIAIDRIEQASTILESQYEQDESADKARLFAVCMVNLGRIRMASGSYDEAKAALDMGLSLLQADEGDKEADEKEGLGPAGRALMHLDPSEAARAQMGAHCGAGIARFKLGEEQEAMEAVRQALEEASEASHKIPLYLLLAQMLWTMGEKEEAESVVLEATSLAATNLAPLLTLGSICSCNDDSEQLKLVESEMQNMPPDTQLYEQSHAFLTSLWLQRGKVDKALEVLYSKPGSSVSLSSRLQVIRLRLHLAIQSRLNSKEQRSSGGLDNEESEAAHQHFLRLAKEDALSLLQVVHSDLSRAESSSHLLASLQCLSIAFILEGDTRQAKKMAMRCMTIAPSYASNWRLLSFLSATE